MSIGADKTARLGHLYLVGFMGAGKTTVGRLLAAELQREFFDTDSLVVEKSGRSIADIFATQGEMAFRELETAVIADLANRPVAVVATGGGAVLSSANRKIMRATGQTIYLEWASDILLGRISGDASRPLTVATSDEPDAELARMLEARRPAYEQADIRVRCGAADSPDRIVTLTTKLLDAQI